MSNRTEDTWTWRDGPEACRSELWRQIQPTLPNSVAPGVQSEAVLFHPADWPIDEADKRLIAAAPELLAACKAVLRHPHIRSYLPYDPTDETFLGLIAAIKKAEGIYV